MAGTVDEYYRPPRSAALTACDRRAGRATAPPVGPYPGRPIVSLTGRGAAPIVDGPASPFDRGIDARRPACQRTPPQHPSADDRAPRARAGPLCAGPRRSARGRHDDVVEEPLRLEGVPVPGSLLHGLHGGVVDAHAEHGR